MNNPSCFLCLRFDSNVLRAFALSFSLFFSLSAFAANSTWTGATDGLWATGTNWSAGMPGTSGSASQNGTSADIATFNNSANTSVSYGNSDRNLGGFNFTGASTGNFSFASAGTNRIYLSLGGTVVMDAAVAQTQTFARIGLSGASGNYTFQNNASASSAILNFSSTFVNNSTGAANLILAGSNTGNNTIGGAISSTTASNLSITKNGAGTWTLNGTNTFSGGVTLGAGTLNIGNASALGAGALTITGGSLDNSSGGTLTNSQNNTQNWNGDFTFVGTSNLNLGNGSVAMNASRQVTVTAGTLTVGGAISGSGFGLTKAGNGTLILSGANTYNGTTAVSAGTLQLGASNIFVSTTNATVATGATLNLNGNTQTFATLSGNGTIAFGTGGNLTVGDATDFSLGGTKTGSGVLTKVGAGRLTLTGSSITGTVNINGGIIDVGSSTSALFGTTGANVLNMDGGTLRYTSGANALSAARVGGGINLNVGGGTFSITPSGTSLDVSAVIGGGGNMTKSGGGSLILSGANNYTGNTIVSGGSLFVNGSLAASSAVAVNTGATLGGNGTIGGGVTVNSGATLSPGNSPGVLTAGSLVLNTGSFSVLEVNGTTTRGTDFDGINVTTGSGLTYGGNLTFTFGNVSALANTTLDIFNFTGSASLSFANVTSSGFYGGAWTNNSGTWSLTSGGQTLSFVQSTGDLSVVPEPAAWVLFAGALTFLMIRRRRRERLADLSHSTSHPMISSPSRSLMLSRQLLGSSLVFFLIIAGTSFVQCEAPKEPVEETVEEDTEAAPPGVTVPEGVRFEGDVDYLPRQDGKKRNQQADLYFPAKIAPGTRVPAVIIIHGGGFNDGDKAKKREINIGKNLALNGYVGMSINYKLRKKPGQVTWPQPVLDAKMAVQWLRANAERLQIDPDRIGAIGGSAGGNLAMMLALTRPEDGLEPEGGPNAGLPTSIRCAVNLYGAVDLMNYHDMKMFNKTREEAPDLYKKASPLTYAHAGAPPILMIHGTADKVVKVSQSEALAAALNNVKAPNELIIIPDAPHTFDLESFIDLRPRVIGFFDKYLKAAP